MPGPVHNPAPVACSLGQADVAERQRRWQALADHALEDVAPTEHGLCMRFRDERGVGAELRDLAALEWDCCSFAGWTVRSGDASHVLDVSGTSQVAVAAVQAMFTGLRGQLEAWRGRSVT